MHKQLNTISRFAIAVLFIARGLSRVFSSDQMNQAIANLGVPIPTVVLILIIGIELSGGLFLFLGYKTDAASKCIIVGLLLSSVFFQDQLLQVLKNLAIIAGLILLINNGAGETFWEYVQTDIKNLPDYKTRL